MSHFIEKKEKILKTALSVLFFPLSITQKIVTKWQMNKHSPIGTIVDLGTHKLHAITSGQRKPTIILDAGMGGCSLDWSFVQPELAKHATILSYDRAGLGWSTRNNEKATSEDYCLDLKILLDKLQLNPPYILVGHSFSGLTMRLFAAKYPEETAGLILVDSVHEHYYLSEYKSISAGKQTKEWKDQQLLLLNLNNNTKQIIAEESYHSIQIYQPNIVIGAVKEQIFMLEDQINKKVN